MKIPDCCYNCKNFDNDYSEMSGETYYFCMKNVWLPTKKQTCKKQKPYKKQVIQSVGKIKIDGEVIGNIYKNTNLINIVKG